MDVIDGLRRQRPCAFDCHATLTAAQRIRAIECIHACDDALRGWGYEPLYDLHGDALWQEAQRADDPGYFKVAVRFGECIYRRLVGSVLHEVLHASFGDTTKPNYGMRFGLPYCVPADVPQADEADHLAPHNWCEARAWSGVWILGARRFGIDWDVKTARDVGTYCFTGGNAIVPPKAPGWRPVAHVDPVHHADRYLAHARRLEAEARAWFTEDHLADILRQIDAAIERGKRARRRPFPSARDVATIAPRKAERNEPCPCGSGRKFKACCGDPARSAPSPPMFTR